MYIEINYFDPAKITDSGQCFRWKRLMEDVYGVTAYDRYLEIRRNGSGFELSCDEDEWKNIWSSYLDMDTDYVSIGSAITASGDEYLKAAYYYGQGIRILRQELWETIISFIISQNNNIKRIRNSIEAICSKAALPVTGKAPEGIYRFPKPGEIDRRFFDDRELGLGYRNIYLADMYEYAVTHPDFPDRLKQMDNSEAMSELKSFKGIGNKVADCICLFGLHHIDSFPIDTHIKQILNIYYPKGYDYERYRGYNGIIQQYMFYYKTNSPN